MLALLEHSPDIYLDEIQEQLQEQHNVSVSLAAISRTLHRLGISSKKVRAATRPDLGTSQDCTQLSRTASERCEEARRAFALEIGAYPVEYLVTADEAAVNVLTTYRTNGWAI